jgi:mRNA-degrading endonuclease RelE of RelBE toxin-antitoxin system
MLMTWKKQVPSKEIKNTKNTLQSLNNINDIGVHNDLNDKEILLTFQVLGAEETSSFQLERHTDGLKAVNTTIYLPLPNPREQDVKKTVNNILTTRPKSIQKERESKKVGYYKFRFGDIRLRLLIDELDTLSKKYNQKVL